MGAGKNRIFALAFRERSGQCLPESTDLGPVGQISNASVVFLKKKKKSDANQR